jgi:hypothetical protein
MDWRHGSRGRATALQAPSPELKERKEKEGRREDRGGREGEKKVDGGGSCKLCE